MSEEVAPARSRLYFANSIIAEIESSYEGKYVVGTNMLTIADCGRRIQLEFFLGNARDRQRSLAKAQLLADVINTFCAELREESKLIEKADKKARRRATVGASKALSTDLISTAPRLQPGDSKIPPITL